MEWYQDFMKKYNETLKTLQGIKPVQDDSLLSSDLTMDGSGFGAMLKDRKDGSPLIKNPIFPTNTDSAMGKVLAVPPGKGQVIIGGKTVNMPKSVLTEEARKNQKIAIDQQSKIPMSDNEAKVPMLKSEDIVNQPNDFFTKVFGMNKDQMMQSWKDKGGFDALMSNPAFMIGLSFLQSSAQGKTISESALNNILKGGGISATYKKLLAGKTTSFEVTAADIQDTKALMSDFGIGDPNTFEQIFSKFKGADAQKGYDAAVENIAMELQKAKVAAQKKAESAGKNFEWGYEQQKKVVENVIRKEKIKHKKGFSIFGIRVTKGILEKDKSSYQLDGSLEHGGTAHEGKSYLVGEKGPEVFIPKETGEVVANDDSQVFTMLLAANPQLQKISKERAMKILKAKFPEYFD
jgi:hypothetical protein